MIRHALVSCTEILLRLTPIREHAVVTGWPSDEGNAVEIARELIRLEVPFAWLDAPSSTHLKILNIAPKESVRFLPKRSFRGYYAFLTSKCVFFTHGLYGNPRPVQGKVFVNLWHGDGPKKEGHSGEGKRPTVPADYFVSSSQVFAQYRAKELGTPSSGILMFGLPRQEQLLATNSIDSLKFIGIDPLKPFIVWLPTYRTSTGTGLVGGWKDGGSQDLRSYFSYVLGRLASDGIQVVAKKHPLDAIDIEFEGLNVVSDSQIAEAGLTLYGLLGASDGLITDYSSVWIDYLMLDRPIGFLVPDEEKYTESRGLYPEDVMCSLPGHKLESSNNIGLFSSEIMGKASGSKLRDDARARFGVVNLDKPAARLLEFLSIQGHLPEAKIKTIEVDRQGKL
ncbi:CDP-glycerol glycerophosphotransferase family protein [Arthrobacter sp. lap29]|uniref:CDP-glycerol glycerophosphotransferase family protein n=1 Tax=Arthrobacter sp. lap29 TaxID=3056122 RepID=UPI0028F702E5|nr:CDP-glycerol glycerophosphotransferase family protein [Arthrobacter sp. lap29]